MSRDMLRASILLAMALTSGISCVEGPPCGGACDPATEACGISGGCAFLQAGNLNPFSEPIREQCFPLPQECVADPSCACYCGEGCGAEEGCEDVDQDGVSLVVVNTACGS